MTERNGQKPEKPLGAAEKTSAKKAAADLTMATQAELNGEKKYVTIANLKIKCPREAANNFQAAINIVVKYFGDLNINLDEMAFKKFVGNIVGESTKEGIEIDPIMLLHPAVRFAHVIAHELAHDKGKIQNELLVESYVRAVLGDDTGVEPAEAYVKAADGFVKFATDFSEEKNAVENTKKIYQLYYAGKYEEIYQKYKSVMIAPHRGDAIASVKAETKALTFFQEIFPELKYTGTGKYNTKPLVETAKQMAAEKTKGAGGDVVSELRKIGKKAIKEEIAGYSKK